MNLQEIFSIQTEEEFNTRALQVFEFQYNNTLVYRNFVDYLGMSNKAITHYSEIPFLPIEFFKTRKILNQNFEPKNYFQSSGTTGQVRSKHYIADLEIYRKSMLKTFTQFVGNPRDYAILGLLPNYLENPHSSLIYMVNELMKISGKAENAYYLNEAEKLLSTLQQLKEQGQPTILFGVSFALLDFIEHQSLEFPELTVIETGGMKGRKEEITKANVLESLRQGFPSSRLMSEYGMTELFSQGYATNSLFYQCPPWMKMLIREIEDPLSWQKENKNGAINIIDLANVNSCSFIATSDLGKKTENGVEILGRLDQSDLRGCSLLLL